MRHHFKAVKILGKRFPVKNKLQYPGALGLYDRVSKSIHINAEFCGKDKDVYFETLIHEMIHALSDHISLIQTLSPEVEEIIADNIGKIIVENFDLKPKK